jgi:hypothetical protein
MDLVRLRQPVKTAQALFWLNAAIWVTLAFASLWRVGTGRGGPAQPIVLWIVAGLMFGNAGALLVAGIGLGRLKRVFWLWGLAVLAVNILLTFTDEFGLLDFLTLVIDLALVGLLVAARRQFH